MSGITLEIAQAKLQEWLAADSAVSKNQSISVDGRTLSRADAAQITEKIEYWNKWVNRLSARRGSRIRQVRVL